MRNFIILCLVLLDLAYVRYSLCRFRMYCDGGPWCRTISTTSASLSSWEGWVGTPLTCRERRRAKVRIEKARRRRRRRLTLAISISLPTSSWYAKSTMVAPF